MAQHARPVGPSAQNNAPTVSVEMFQGQRPAPKWNGYSTRTKGGAQLSQTTHVAAPFIPAMIEATRPQEPSVPKFARTTGVAPPDSAPFQFEGMFNGRPHVVPRPHKPSRGPNFFPWSGTPAQDSVDMFDGCAPDKSRAQAPHKGDVFAAPDVVAFTIDSILATRPERARILLGPKIPLPVSQTTQVNAPFTVDMVDGWFPDRQRYTAPFHQGVQWWTPEVVVFDMAAVYGHKPDRPRLEPSGTQGKRAGWSVSQPTHTSAPFSVEMADGWAPDRQRYLSPSHQGQQVWTVEVDAFSIDMVIGSRPDTSRAFTPPKLGWVWWTPEQEPFDFTTVIGSKPDRPRMLLGVRIPLPVSQTTHVQAPFSTEMIQGARPSEKSHAFWALKTVTYTQNYPTLIGSSFTAVVQTFLLDGQTWHWLMTASDDHDLE